MKIPLITIHKQQIRKVAGYGWPGRGANAGAPRGMRVRLPHLPLLALVVKRTSRLASNEEVRVRLLAGALGQSRGRVAKAPPRHGGDRWFDSTRDYFRTSEQ